MHIPGFVKLKYIHVTIGTFSCNFASAHTGECAKDDQCHFLSSFSALRVPVSIKTDNGLAYTSKQMVDFFHLWECNMSQVFHIPLQASHC